MNTHVIVSSALFLLIDVASHALIQFATIAPTRPFAQSVLSTLMIRTVVPMLLLLLLNQIACDAGRRSALLLSSQRVKPHFVAESLITSTVKDALSRAPRETCLATRVRVRPRDQPESDLTTEEERRLIASLRQMHTNVGHSSNHPLARAIRVTGGSAAAVRAALQLRCDVCESQQHPGPHCWKFESRHSPDMREEECCLYLQHEHVSRASFLVCLSVFACTPVQSKSPTTSTDSLACFAGALTTQLSDSCVSQNMCSALV